MTDFVTEPVAAGRHRTTIDRGWWVGRGPNGGYIAALIAQQRSYKTLERLCAAIAERLISDFDVEYVWVKAAKPEPPIPLPVDEVSVELWREPEE